MARRSRTRGRTRPAQRAAQRAAPTIARHPTARPTRAPVRGGTARATGAPSAALERAAAWERGYVVKDFRRIGIVVAIMFILLALSDVAVNRLQP